MVEGDSVNTRPFQIYHLTSEPISSSVTFEPFRELKPAAFTPTQRIGCLAADAATHPSTPISF